MPDSVSLKTKQATLLWLMADWMAGRELLPVMSHVIAWPAHEFAAVLRLLGQLQASA